jgi:hypothetical protein
MGGSRCPAFLHDDIMDDKRRHFPAHVIAIETSFCAHESSRFWRHADRIYASNLNH